MENQDKPGHFYNWFGNYLKNELKPKAIVIISAHWQGQGNDGVFGMISSSFDIPPPWPANHLSFRLVETSEKPKLIYDFFNFPRRYYEMKWDHKGSPAIADQVVDLLNKVFGEIVLHECCLGSMIKLRWYNLI